jgi:V/A-type H+-transporting ATPase subunit D
MERLRVSATRSNLLRLKDELAFAREGKELLTQKRKLLVMEMLQRQKEAQQAREEFDALLVHAYRAFAEAAMVGGFDGLERLALAIPEDLEIRLKEHSIMGVVVPSAEGRRSSWRPAYGLAGDTLAADDAVRLFRDVTERLAAVAAVETAIFRLAMETRKTLRRERALEHMFIPQYAATVAYIDETLEEKDREGIFQMKLLKRRAGE